MYTVNKIKTDKRLILLEIYIFNKNVKIKQKN